MQKIVRAAIYIAGTLLFVTAIAKCISAMGSARILANPDPIFGLPFRNMFWIVGIIELAISAVCFLSKSLRLPASLVAWLATNFLLYRLGLVWIHYHEPCGCLGNLTDAIHIPSHITDKIMRGVLFYLIISSYTALFWLWRKGKKPSTVAAA